MLLTERDDFGLVEIIRSGDALAGRFIERLSTAGLGRCCRR
ncbi:MAG: hypothetical protein RIG82_11955 [Phycisphaeraceae bacterium]